MTAPDAYVRDAFPGTPNAAATVQWHARLLVTPAPTSLVPIRYEIVDAICQAGVPTSDNAPLPTDLATTVRGTTTEHRIAVPATFDVDVMEWISDATGTTADTSN
ncbi:MAG: hypothetical protein QM658_02945 [Gordonia sp. (in: high G+C Gram-positive bacteria)]